MRGVSFVVVPDGMTSHLGLQRCRCTMLSLAGDLGLVVAGDALRLTKSSCTVSSPHATDVFDLGIFGCVVTDLAI